MDMCPRCGLMGTRSVEKRNGRFYVYYVHYDSKSGKLRKCYIGPVEGYRYVEKLHSLALDNLEDVDYIAVALNALNCFVNMFMRLRDSDVKRGLVERFALFLENAVKMYEMLKKELDDEKKTEEENDRKVFKLD
ncbi:MAG: hypothetical protein QW456_10320 [Ignisphaera sp.]